MKKRGQVQFSVFITIIVVGIVLMGSLKLISVLKNFSEDREFRSFQDNIRNSIQSMRKTKGETKVIDLIFPKSVNKIYIFDTQSSMSSIDFFEEPIVDDALKSEVEHNVFLFDGHELVESFFLEGLDMPSNPYVCINNLNRQNVKIEIIGTGKGVELSLQDQEVDCTTDFFIREIVTELFGESPEFLAKLDEFMEYFENIEKIKVEKIVEYDPFTDKTKITIKINVEPPVNNLEYYEYIPKCIIQQVNDISLPSSPLIIKDDPLVMWDFGDVSDVNTREIAYLRDKKKLTETCEKIMESFAKGDGSRISSGIIGRQRSRYQHNDNDGISNGEDIFPDDSDDDGFPDVWEAQYSFDVDDSTSPGNFLIPGTDIPRDLSSYTVISFEIDKDGDGLSDYREYKFGSSPIKIDTDNDGVNDNIEFFFMLDPNCRDSERAHGVNPGSFEWWNSPCSGDGMPDLWEVEHSSVTIPTGPLYGEVEFVDFPDEYSIRSGGLNPHIDDSNFDFDFDGLTNIEEYLSGTDPQDQASSVECPGNHDDCGNLKGKGICGNCIGCEWDYEEDGCVNEDIIPNTACILQTESTCIGNCIWCAPMIYNTYTILQGVCLPENKNCYCDIAGLNCDSSCDMPGLTEIQKEDCNKQCCSRCDDSDMCPVGCTDDDDACESIY